MPGIVFSIKVLTNQPKWSPAVKPVSLFIPCRWRLSPAVLAGGINPPARVWGGRGSAESAGPSALVLHESTKVAWTTT